MAKSVNHCEASKHPRRVDRARRVPGCVDEGPHRSIEVAESPGKGVEGGVPQGAGDGQDQKWQAGIEDGQKSIHFPKFTRGDKSGYHRPRGD